MIPCFFVALVFFAVEIVCNAEASRKVCVTCKVSIYLICLKFSIILNAMILNQITTFRNFEFSINYHDMTYVNTHRIISRIKT